MTSHIISPFCPQHPEGLHPCQACAKRRRELGSEFYPTLNRWILRDRPDSETNKPCTACNQTRSRHGRYTHDYVVDSTQADYAARALDADSDIHSPRPTHKSREATCSHCESARRRYEKLAGSLSVKSNTERGQLRVDHAADCCAKLPHRNNQVMICLSLGSIFEVFERSGSSVLGSDGVTHCVHVTVDQLGFGHVESPSIQDATPSAPTEPKLPDSGAAA